MLSAGRVPRNDVIYMHPFYDTGRVVPPARQVLARDRRPAEVLGTRQEAVGWPSSA